MVATADNCPEPSARPSTTYTRTLHRACQNVGSANELARRLGVPVASLVRWMEGVENPPVNVFLAAVDIALSPPPAANQ
jgi:DNA-binding transcriptional regulator YdaS (Cro superfamily)